MPDTDDTATNNPIPLSKQGDTKTSNATSLKSESPQADPSNPVDLYKQVMQATDYYQVLGVDQKTADDKKINDAFEHISKHIQPPNPPYQSIEPDEHTKRLKEARDALLTAEMRATYDAQLKLGEGKIEPLLEADEEQPANTNEAATKPKQSALNNILMDSNTNQDDPLLRLWSSLQNMALSMTDIREKFNLIKNVTQLIGTAADTLRKNTPEELIDAAKEFMGSLTEGFKNFFSYKNSSKKDEQQTASNPALSKPSNTAISLEQLATGKEDMAKDVVKTAVIGDAEQTEQQEIEAGKQTKQQEIQASEQITDAQQNKL